MNLTRLVILGLLAEHGPRHGHQLRRDAELAEVDRWAGVGVGSLHRELRSLATAGLIEEVRTERVGRRPERTVYRLAGAGRQELAALRRQAASELDAAPDPLSVLLVFAGTSDPAELGALLAEREQALRARAAALAAERAAGEAAGYLLPSVAPLQAASFRRAEIRVAGELAWHQECGPLLEAARRPTVAAGPDHADPGR